MILSALETQTLCCYSGCSILSSSILFFFFLLYFPTDICARFSSLETSDRLKTLTQCIECSQFAVDYFFR